MKRNDPLLYVHPVLLLNSLNLICINKTTSVCVCVCFHESTKRAEHTAMSDTQEIIENCVGLNELLI